MAKSALAQDIARQHLPHLRQMIAKIEDRGAEHKFTHKHLDYAALDIPISAKSYAGDCLPFDIHTFDEPMHGGVPMAALTEFRCAQTRQSGALSAFIWILMGRIQSLSQHKAPIIWITEPASSGEGGTTYYHGLPACGVDPETCLFIQAKNLQDALWAAELSASYRHIAAVVLQVRGNPHQLDLAGTRRFHLRARASGRPFFLVRQMGCAEATAAPFRFEIKAAPSGERVLRNGKTIHGSLSYPRFEVFLEKSRAVAPVQSILEWNYDTAQFEECLAKDAVSTNDFGHQQAPNHIHRVSLFANRSHHAAKAGYIMDFRSGRTRQKRSGRL